MNEPDWERGVSEALKKFCESIANYSLPKPKWWWRFVPNWNWLLRLIYGGPRPSKEDFINEVSVSFRRREHEEHPTQHEPHR